MFIFKKIRSQPHGGRVQQCWPRRAVMRSTTVHRVIRVKCSAISRQLTRILYRKIHMKIRMNEIKIESTLRILGMAQTEVVTNREEVITKRDHATQPTNDRRERIILAVQE